MCARALLVFVLVCAFSGFLNAGRSFENSSQRVLIVLVLHCYGNGNKKDARATPVEDRRPGIAIWLNPVWCLRAHRLSPLGASLHLRGECYTLMGATASAVPRLRVWGITSPLKLEES